MREPRQCKVYGLGWIIAMRWTPRLGLGYGERKKPWPKRWTFGIGREWIGFHR